MVVGALGIAFRGGIVRLRLGPKGTRVASHGWSWGITVSDVGRLAIASVWSVSAILRVTAGGKTI